MRFIIFHIVIAASVLFTSCSSYEYENIHEFENGWHQDSVYKFEFEISDVNSNYNINYKLRNNLDYQYYNLYLKYFIIDANGKTVSSSVQEIILMDSKTGKPYGKGFSDIYQHSFTALKKFNFEKPGKYTMQVGQYMRIKQLEGILSVGMTLKKSNE